MPEDLSTIESLIEVLRKLRGPGGCPWDKKQTHETMRENLLEECYEVLESIDEGDMQGLKVELGDLLMQVIFHAQIAEDNGDFDLGEVVKGINEKLIRRHPHVFGDTSVEDTKEVLANWEAIKKKERKKHESMLNGSPKSMPALSYSQDIQGRAANVGFDWEEDSGVLEKLTEEIAELNEAENEERKAEEFGDVMFTLANIARRQGVDLESALRQANQRFYKRFNCMEDLCREKGLNFAKLSFDDKNILWEEAKKKTC